MALKKSMVMEMILKTNESCDNETVIIMKDIKKNYIKNKKEINILNNLNIKFKKGKFYAIMGHSGSGKSTLINIIGLLDSFDDGKYIINGNNVNNLSETNKADIKRKCIGFIFQEFLLDPYLKAYENVMLPLYSNSKLNNKERKLLSLELLKKMELEDRTEHFPKELSGGEMQRVAIARSLANNPDIILADEPTGNLDIQNEKKVFNILKKLSQNGKCIIVVSHSNEVINYADHIYILKDGNLREQKYEI